MQTVSTSFGLRSGHAQYASLNCYTERVQSGTRSRPPDKGRSPAISTMEIGHLPPNTDPPARDGWGQSSPSRPHFATYRAGHARPCTLITSSKSYPPSARLSTLGPERERPRGKVIALFAETRGVRRRQRGAYGRRSTDPAALYMPSLPISGAELGCLDDDCTSVRFSSATSSTTLHCRRSGRRDQDPPQWSELDVQTPDERLP
jgi:hypothetical protein